jgi:hypothetical protein
MTPAQWAELEAAHKALSSSASSAISREYSNLAQLSVTLLPAILAYHKRAEEIRQEAREALAFYDAEAVHGDSHDIQVGQMTKWAERLRAALEDLQADIESKIAALKDDIERDA